MKTLTLFWTFFAILSILPKRIYMTNNVLVQLGIEQYLPSIFNICKRAGLYCSSLGCDLMKYFCDIIIFSPTFSVQFCFCKIYFLFMYNLFIFLIGEKNVVCSGVQKLNCFSFNEKKVILDLLPNLYLTTTGQSSATGWPRSYRK